MSGSSYNYFRQYDPALGRFVQADPIGLKGGTNVYLYVLANPIRWTDPFGLDKCDPEAALAAEARRARAAERVADARKRQDWDALAAAEAAVNKFVQEYLEAMGQAGEESTRPKAPPEPSIEPDDNSTPVDPGNPPKAIFDE